MAYDLLITDRLGVPSRDITSKANFIRRTGELNVPEVVEIEMESHDPATLDVVGANGANKWKKYLQLWRDNTCQFFGPLVFPELDGPVTRIAFKDPLEILRRRFFGPAPSIDAFGYQTAQAVPGATVLDDFPPAGLTGWTAIACTASVSADTRADGSNAVKLVNGTALADASLERTFTYTPPDITTGSSTVPLFIKAWFYLESISAPALDERGLFVLCDQPAGTLRDQQWASITKNTPVGGWYRQETVINVPTGPTELTSTIKMRLYAPQGTIYWDAPNVFRRWTRGAAIFPATGVPEIIDYGEVIRRVIDYAAGRTAEARSIGKSDLGWDVNVEDCGTTDYRNYFLDANQNIYDALMDDYVKTGLYDFAVLPKADGTGWTFHGWSPTRGTDHPTLALELGGNVNVGVQYRVDGTQATNKPRVLGRGTGPSRESVEVFDSAVFDGLTLESVETAAADAPLSALRPRADELLRVGSLAGEIPSVVVTGGHKDNLLRAGVGLGDTIPTIIDYGWASDDSSRRIVREVETAHDLTLDLNAS